MQNKIKKDSEWIAWVQQLYATCVNNATEWGLETSQLTKLSTLYNTANAAYEANAPLEARNHKTASAKDEAFKFLHEFLSVFILSLTANLKITNGQLVAMGLNSREHHHKDPLPRPPKAPFLEAFAGKHHVIDAYVSAEQLGNTTTYVREEPRYTVILKYKFEGEDEWHEVHSTRLHIRLDFTAADVQKHVTLTAAWSNPRFEYGPWSNEVTVLVN
jgi:hypothetical protein